MRIVNLKQIIILILIFFFLFGDFFSLKKKLNKFFNYCVQTFLKNRKKGT